MGFQKRMALDEMRCAEKENDDNKENDSVDQNVLIPSPLLADSSFLSAFSSLWIDILQDH